MTSANPFAADSTSPSQTPGRPTVSGLAAYEKNRIRKRLATSSLNDRTGPTSHTLLGTPRSVRFKNIFKETSPNPSLLEVTRKLYDVIEGSILLPKKGGEKISSLGSETAADIKILAATVLDLVEKSSNIPLLNRQTLPNDDDEHLVERALAGPNTFGCKVPDIVEARLDSIDKAITEIKNAFTLPNSKFSFKVPTKQQPTTPSYALAASRHAPNASANRPTESFQPVHARKQPPPPPPQARSQNTVKLAQSVDGGSELASMSYPTLITTVNKLLGSLHIKENPTDTKAIQIRLVHQHPSNDLVLYTTTPNQADRLRQQGSKWLTLLSPKLSLRPPIFTVVVHGIPTSFNPTCPDHLSMLKAMNPDTLDTPLVFVKWISPQAVQKGVSHSSIRIGFTSAEQAKRAVEERIFYGNYNKKTEHGRITKTRCMNCLQEGHTSKFCKTPVLCPYCAETHHADTCPIKSRTTSNCTACARRMKDADPALDLKHLFSTTPLVLRHSPLDPTCPARIAAAVDKARKATEARQQQPQETPQATLRTAENTVMQLAH